MSFENLLQYQCENTLAGIYFYIESENISNYYGVFFTLLPNTLQGVKVNFYTITLFHHEYFPFLFLVLHLLL